jgi:hypothetical protein
MTQSATILQRLQRRAADAQDGNEGLSAAFRQLGIDVNRFVALDPVEAFLQVAIALGKVAPQAKKIQLAFKLFDSEGVQVLQANLPNLRKELAATTAISDKQAKTIKALADAWAKLGEEVRSLTALGIEKLNLPSAVEGMAKFGGQVRKRGLLDAYGERYVQTMSESIAAIAGVFGLGPPGGAGQPSGLRAQSGHLTNIPPETGLTGQIRGDRTFIGGALGESDAILEVLRGIRRNTESGMGAVLE